MTAPFTETQGQYLAFIYTYTKLHRRPPAEADFQAYFQVTPPTAHRMIVVLTERGLIRRRPGAPRTSSRSFHQNRSCPSADSQSIKTPALRY